MTPGGVSAPAASRVIVRPPGPEQLDRLLRVAPSSAWAALVVLTAATLAALVWSFVSTAPVKAQAPGILLTPGGVADVSGSAAGRLAELSARPGDRVVKGQIVARIHQPDLADRLESKHRELAGLIDQRRRVGAFHAAETAAREKLSAERRAAIAARAVALRDRAATLSEMLTGQRDLLAKGLINRDRALATMTQLQDVQGQLSDAENSAVEMAAEDETQRNRAAREMLDLDMRVAAAEREIAALTGDLGRSAVVAAPWDGLVVELSANVGEMITAGAPLMRMLPDEGDGAPRAPLAALLYASPGDGKKMKPGMPVQIIPATARVQRDGFIHGVVASVSPIAATRESMMRTLKNSVLVEQLTRNGPPVEVAVRLERDPDSPSGFRWSSGRGPDRAIESGATVEGRVVVDRIHLIALAIPQAEALFSGTAP